MAETGTALTRVEPTQWRIACEREPAIRALAAEPRLSRNAIMEAGAGLGLSRSRIYELVARYRECPVTSSLVDQRDGFPKGRSRLEPELDRVIDAKIEKFYLSRPKPKLSQLVREIRYACLERNLRPPARQTIVLRVNAVEKARLIKARDGAKASADRFRPVTASYDADYPLKVVQMDHTPADIIIVDEYFRRPLGRPTLTLQIDVATRVIPGFYISLESPSATSVGMAIRHAVLPKDDWLADRELTFAWPVFGLPVVLHLDNASEFHSRALTRGCQQFGIELHYRPRRTPHYGGHIERLIGTTIGEVHLLPGTTFSNVKDKGDYDAEGKACMTLKEFERWFALQVGIYHGTIHSALGVPPLTAWHYNLSRRPGPLRLPVDEERFLLDFLPFEMRRVRREGIKLFHVFYWHGALTALIANSTHKFPIKYNPLNLSAVYLELPSGEHVTVPLRDKRRPAITKFEHDHALRALRERGRSAIDEQMLYEMVSTQRRIVLEAVAKTRGARRSAQRLVDALGRGEPPPDLAVTRKADAQSPRPTLEGPVVPLAIEERS
ncbi:Mu transposase C-terminal domain-containing protein [Sphingobium estronivorans]|uniref:Mu transposase C-terminal domain-containing protein n=1 Tax=Sphingobium estronivorans TaxID=1577690 RepID=UPI001239860F|nr:Mu transposase C-terminal domain-containing protein [Sphingobium estronivorans]